MTAHLRLWCFGHVLLLVSFRNKRLDVFVWGGIYGSRVCPRLWGLSLGFLGPAPYSRRLWGYLDPPKLDPYTLNRHLGFREDGVLQLLCLVIFSAASARAFSTQQCRLFVCLQSVLCRVFVE